MPYPFRFRWMAVAPIILTPLSLWADIGGIGSPVTPSNADVFDTPSAATAEAQPDTRKPLFVLRYKVNEHLPYFSPAFTTALNKAEVEMPGANYEIISYAPESMRFESPLGKEYYNKKADENIAQLLLQFEVLRIDKSRINVRSEQGTSADQEVRIYLR